MRSLSGQLVYIYKIKCSLFVSLNLENRWTYLAYFNREIWKFRDAKTFDGDQVSEIQFLEYLAKLAHCKNSHEEKMELYHEKLFSNNTKWTYWIPIYSSKFRLLELYVFCSLFHIVPHSGKFFSQLTFERRWVIWRV